MLELGKTYTIYFDGGGSWKGNGKPPSAVDVMVEPNQSEPFAVVLSEVSDEGTYITLVHPLGYTCKAAVTRQTRDFSVTNKIEVVEEFNEVAMVVSTEPTANPKKIKVAISCSLMDNSWEAYCVVARKCDIELAVADICGTHCLTFIWKSDKDASRDLGLAWYLSDLSRRIEATISWLSPPNMAIVWAHRPVWMESADTDPSWSNTVPTDDEIARACQPPTIIGEEILDDIELELAGL